MTTASPWSVKGIDPKARDMAKDLARRSGMTLGEWLNQVIEGEGGSPEIENYQREVGYRGIPARDFTPDPPFKGQAPDAVAGRAGELQRIMRILDQLSARIEAAEHRSTLAISGIDQSVMGVLSRLEGVERGQGAVAARFDGALEEVRQDHSATNERVRRLMSEDAPRLEAMKALEGALGKLAEQVYESETKARGTLNAMREDVSNVARRMDRAEARLDGEPEAALVDGVVARIGARLEQAEAKTSEAVKALESSFADLDARIRTSEAKLGADADSKLERLAAELSDRFAVARAETAARLKDAADGKLDRMQTALRGLADHVEQGEKRSAEAIETLGKEVTRVASVFSERMSKAEARNTEASQQVGGEMARIADAIEKRLTRQDTAQAQALEKLGGEITRIAEKLAERIAGAERRSTQSIEDVGEQLGRVTERLNQRYDRAQSDLADRIQQSEARTAKLLDEAREKIDARLSEHQRRAALEAAQDAARQAAQDEDGEHQEPAPTPPSQVDLDYLPNIFNEPGFSDGAFDSPPEASAEVATPAESFDPAAPFEVFADTFQPSPPDTPAVEAAPPPFEEPSSAQPPSTRDVLEQARIAMRQASERPDVRNRRGGVDAPPPGSAPVPPYEGEPSKLFGLLLPKRKKKDGVTLRTALVASGTAAALAVTGAGAVLMLNAETGGAADHSGEHFGVAPTAAAPTAVASTVGAPVPPPPAAQAQVEPQAPSPATAGPVSDTSAQMAVALTPAPGQSEGLKAPSPAPQAPAVATGGAEHRTLRASAEKFDVHTLYSSAVRRIESGDFGGVADLKRAANLNDAPAQFYLAKLYETGGAGLTKDLVEARRWTERAADNGDVSAMHNLGLYYYEGEAGVQDSAKAALWFQRAADQGVKDSQFNLAMLYAKGLGVPKNPAEAYKWYLVAASEGDEGARAAARALRPELTPEIQSASERAAAAFHAQTQNVMRTASVNP
jgi:localization factor PodJL